MAKEHWKKLQDSHKMQNDALTDLAADIEAALKTAPDLAALPNNILKQIAIQGAQIVMMSSSTVVMPHTEGQTEAAN
jgi:hypothetical protein